MTRDRTLSSVLTLAAILLASCSAAVEESQAEPPLEDGWNFSYPDRSREGKSLIDLRSLNEPVAGQSGFVKLSPDGNSFVLGDGTPARFWAVGSEIYHDHPVEDIQRHVQFLARMGVNLVRIHAQICSAGPKSKINDVNEKEIDGIWRFVAEAKKQGIYVTISPYWAHNLDSTLWGIEGYESPGGLWGILFFDETLQQGYKAWARALYSRPNPYTKIPLAKDPAVALIQVQNEDSLLFWTTAAMKPAQKARFARKFADWLVKKHGSLDASKRAWSGASLPDDDFAAGKVGMVDMYQMTVTQPGGLGRRVADQTAFFANTQRDFYANMAAFYRKDLGCGQLINASNWRTASQTVLDDSERWSNASTDVIAVNRYYNGGVHQGANAGWRIDPGDKFTQKSALLNPQDIPTNLKQVVGHPMAVTESSWVSPLAYQSEAPFLVAAYQSLTGVDAYYWFTLDAVEFKMEPHFPYQKVNGQMPLLKWSASIPSILAGFPADALLFRKRYVKQGEPVVHEERALSSLWNRETPLIAEDPSFDPNRDQGKPKAVRAGDKSTIVDPLAFLVGPVEVKYDGDPTKTKVADLSRYINHDKKQIRSITGEVMLDYKVGLCTIDAPKAQGACGFLDKAGAIKLTDLTIQSTNVYATVVAVSLDDRPLATSKRILLQIVTAARPTGWSTRSVEFKAEGDKMTQGLEVVNTGTPPWRIADARFQLSLKNAGLTKATRLDTAGYPVKEMALTRSASGVTLTPPTDAMYLILE